jgi:hypothetical protein
MYIWKFSTAQAARIEVASAAEYLVAALKEGLPEITTIFGEKSYGKSHSTALLPLSGNSQLHLEVNRCGSLSTDINPDSSCVI